MDQFTVFILCIGSGLVGFISGMIATILIINDDSKRR